ncbi:MAG: hypothetical protein ACI3XH_04035 [Phascolarctobacterium sp.]
MDKLYFFLYVFLGYNANQYLRRHLLGQVGVIYFDTGRYILKEFFYACVLGFITIPLAIIVFLFRSLLSSK